MTNGNSLSRSSLIGSEDEDTQTVTQAATVPEQGTVPDQAPVNEASGIESSDQSMDADSPVPENASEAENRTETEGMSQVSQPVSEEASDEPSVGNVVPGDSENTPCDSTPMTGTEVEIPAEEASIGPAPSDSGEAVSEAVISVEDYNALIKNVDDFKKEIDSLKEDVERLKREKASAEKALDDEKNRVADEIKNLEKMHDGTIQAKNRQERQYEEILDEFVKTIRKISKIDYADEVLRLVRDSVERKRLEDSAKEDKANLGAANAKLDKLKKELDDEKKAYAELETSENDRYNQMCSEKEAKIQGYTGTIAILNEKNKELTNRAEESEKTQAKTAADLETVKKERDAKAEALGKHKTFLEAQIPTFLKDDTEFCERLVQGQMNCETDASMQKLFAVLMLMAAAERDIAPKEETWCTLLVDFGGALSAFYRDSCQYGEADIRKRLQTVAVRLSQVGTLNSLSIYIKVPQIGGELNHDEMRHVDNGSSINCVMNWCVLYKNGVFARAQVA